MKLELKGSKKYLEYMSKHLQVEHPKTKGHLKLKR